MRPITVSVGPLATADADGICLSQTPTSGTALTINGALASGGVATLDYARRVLFTTGSEAAQRTIAITGTDWAGNPISETVTIPASTAGTVASVLDYKTVTSLVPAGGGFTAALTVGTNGVAASSWVRMDDYSFAPAALQCVVSGTVNYDVQQTMDDPNSLTNPVARASVAWTASADTAVVGATATKMSSFSAVPTFVRVLLNSGTGTVTMTITQSASPN